MHVCIIGAGVIGTTTAWQFARQGARVTLLDASAGAGLGTSLANGGQLSYSYVAPLADPGVFPHLPKWLLDGGSPLRFRPALDPQQWRWCLRFLRACRAETVRETTAAMLTLSYLSRDTLHQWMADTPVDFHHQTNGKLIAYRSAALLDKARKLVAYQASQGSQQVILSRQQCTDLEPALDGLGDRLAGAIYTPGEEVGDCHLFTQGLFNALEQQSGASLRMNARVARLRREHGRIIAAELDNGEAIQADQFVLAAGLHSRQLLRSLGDDAMLYGLRGYSLSVPLSSPSANAPPPKAPSISITDYERRIVYAPIGDVLRIAAMVDMGGRGPAINQRRIALLKQQVNDTFPGLPLQQAGVWAGERPATPEGKPIIGRSKAADNLWLNIGHGALGFTLSCGSAVLLESMVSGRSSPIAPAPFAPH
ncbi:D-amino acid dehydrogenase [Allopusillimonas ginsengisoli]|uniref:D-amino acid dehydrogenase n=1 Tax=Allopusillimonas ginsengisoli TaxID=453575 RepID=UPI00102019DE|nr:D-amino acid dehydrogenase [Allopusillimonas ginsengisoli]TEA78967.1 D-amino acid dehydrogenase [Allopusillimonas ginsengisoli]